MLAAAVLTAQERTPDYEFYDRRMFEPPGVQVSMQALRVETPPSAGEPEAIARAFLEDHRDRLGIDSTAFFSLPLERRYESPGAGMTHLVFQRRYAGIPVFGGDAVAHLDREGRIIGVHGGSPWPPGARPVLAPALTAPQASESALRILDGAAGGEARARLVWFPLAAEVRLGWELYLDLGPGRWYCVVIDAASGELLFSHNLYRDQRPQGSVFRAAAVPHPNAGPPSTESFTGWPVAAGICPGPAYPRPTERCWVSGSETAGNNAAACLDADGDNRCDWRAAHPQAQFLFPFGDSYAATGDAVPDRAAAVTNLFYWTNVLHDWLYRLGFDEPSGNFQADNFGRGGFGGDPVLADAQDGAALNTANFATPPDGLSPRMQVGLFTNNGSFLRRDAAFDGDILTHEYVHGLTQRLVGGPFNTNALALWQSGALAEGWSDAYAASFTGDPLIGEYVSATPATGIRSVSYANSPHTFGRFGTLYRRNIAALGLVIDLPQIHRDGEIWATVLWELRAALGKATFEQVLTNALKITPARPSMLEARDAILQAGPALGVSPCAMWGVFAARGFGASAALNRVQSGQARDTALSLYEAFDTPAACGGSPPQPGAAVLVHDAESGAGGWTAAGLWHITSRRAAAGTRSWWFGQESTGNYATGARTTGTLTSPPIDLSGVSRAVLEWDQLFRGEGFGRRYTLGPAGGDPYLNYDSGWVLVSRDGGATWETLTTLAHNSDPGLWDPHRVDLSRYAGGVIRLRFLFDSLDANNNFHEGWYVDNIRVRPLNVGVPALRVTPSSLALTAVAGGAPPSASLRLESGGWAWTATASSSGWLAVAPSAGSGGAGLTVTALSGSLPPGVYAGSVTVTAPGASGSPAVVPVTLTLTGPAAWWRFEETGAGPGVSLADASGGGRGGSTAGYGTVAVPGVVGRARLFNGVTDSAVVAAASALSPPSFTFSAWVKLLSYPAAAGWGVIAANYGGNYQGWYLGVHASGRVIWSVASLPASSPWLLSNTALTPGRWYRITATYDGPSREGAIYVNGAVDVRAAFPGFTPQSALPLTLARASWFAGYYLHAVLDEAVLYPLRQDPAQALADYLSFPEPPAPPANLGVPGEWRLDDSGSTLADASGNGRAATTTGAAVTAGVRNGARLFNGVTDRAQAPASEAFSPASFTVRAWVKLAALPSGWGVVVSSYGGDYQGWYLGVHSSGRVIFSVASLPSHSPWLLSARSLTVNRWHHVTAAYEAAAQRATVYIDGALDAQAVLAGFTPGTSANLLLGRASWYDGYYLNAALDEVRIEGAARTASEVLADYLLYQ